MTDSKILKLLTCSLLMLFMTVAHAHKLSTAFLNINSDDHQQLKTTLYLPLSDLAKVIYFDRNKAGVDKAVGPGSHINEAIIVQVTERESGFLVGPEAEPSCGSEFKRAVILPVEYCQIF